jgi:hypothetical protein
MGWDPATQAYAARRTGEGLSKPEILRCLKRYIACAVQAHRHPPRFAHIVPRRGARLAGRTLSVVAG